MCDRLLEFFIEYDEKMRTTELKYFHSEQADIYFKQLVHS